MKGVRHGPQSPVRLFAVYAIASLLPVLLLGFVLAASFRGEANARALSEARSEAALIAHTAVEPLLSGRPLAQGVTPQEAGRLRQLAVSEVGKGQVLRLRLRDLAGRVVFSGDGSGLKEVADPDAAEAGRDGARAEITHLNTDSNDSGRRGVPAVEVYLPLSGGTPQRRVGVLEIYMPYVPIARDVSHGLNRLYVYLAIGLAVLWLVLLAITASTTRGLRRSAKLNAFLAEHDVLTALPNRTLFHRRAGAAVAAAQRNQSSVVIGIVDLDRFKAVNDTLGHQNGDRLLFEVAARLAAHVRPRDTVARLGGDEFGLLPAEDTHDLSVLEHLVTRLTACVNRPFAVDELSLEVGASIGLSRYPEDGPDSHALLRCADIAMYAAKEAQTDYKVYAAEQNQHSVRRLNVLSDIRHALASDEIVVHYQPIVDLDDLSVTGAEGLVRWQHPKMGLIPPGAFVQTVEQTGLIGPLTRHVLERSIAECAAWRRDGRDLSVAVNLSVRNLLDRDLPKEIEHLLSSYSLPPDALQLEITESMIMSDPDRALTTVTRLSDLGVRMSVDDFGTGYSSLANLRRLPIDELKIDRSFVSPMLKDESDLIIVRSTINLGHDLGLKIIAEGVEDGATLERLALLGCDLAQGYHLSRPMPADAFNVWLRHAAPGLATNGTASNGTGANGSRANGAAANGSAAHANGSPVDQPARNGSATKGSPAAAPAGGSAARDRGDGSREPDPPGALAALP
jgi:diguanylate cyclase (GGDEF)-like protein